MTGRHSAAALTFILALTIAVAAMMAQAPLRVIKVVGDNHKLLLRDDGSVAGWGQWQNGQLGAIEALGVTGRVVDHLVHIALPDKAVDIAAAQQTSFAVLAGGTVVGWGSGEFGQLGVAPDARPLLPSSTPTFPYRGITRPTRIAGITTAVAVAADSGAAYAVLRDGTVRAWGNGSLGDGRLPSERGGPSRANGPVLTPIRVPGLQDVIAISAGGGRVLTVTRDGRVFSWGSNFYGALGRSPRTEMTLDSPGEVPGLGDVIQVVAGLGISTALKKDGTVWVWGSNWQQQYGFPAPTDQPGPDRGWQLTPQQVPGITGAVEIALGGRHTLVRLKDGTLRVWGNTDFGQLGTGAGPGYQPRPVSVKIAGVARVFAAGNNSFAVRTDGSFWAWGSGARGEWPLTAHVRVPTPAPPGLE